MKEKLVPHRGQPPDLVRFLRVFLPSPVPLRGGEMPKESRNEPVAIGNERRLLERLEKR